MDTHISVILKITDRFRKKPLLAQEAAIFLGDLRIKPLYKAGGYFVFTDLQPGTTIFRIVSPVFQTAEVTVDIPAEDSYALCHIMMNPARSYPFGNSVTTVSGRLISNGSPMKAHKFHIVPGEGGEVMKVAEDKAEAGNSRLKLFASVPERQLSIPGKYLIKDKDENKREFCFITQGADKDGAYPLEGGLLNNHMRATPLVGVIECVTCADGSFFSALPELKGDGATVDFLLTDAGGKSRRKSFKINNGKENDLLDIEC